MPLGVLALHQPLHHCPSSHFVPEPDPQVHEIPARDEDQEKDQDFSRPDNELDHASFSLLEPDEWHTATPHIRWELSIPLVERLHLEHFR